MKATKVGVISDTHYSNRLQQNFPFDQIKKAFKEIELIIHAGDITDACVLDMLGEIAPVEAVRGNMDCDELGSRLLHSKVVDIAGTLIGVAHKKNDSYFEGEKVDAIVFGHTHAPFNKVVNGILYFNPGSPVKPALPFPPSVGILTITAPHHISASVINLI
jgi:putative phosphoesterase